MGIILHLAAAIIGLYLYSSERKGWFLILLYAVMTSFFGYLPIGNIGKDIGVLMIVYTLIYTPKCYDIKQDSIKKWIIILLAYYTARCIFSILLGEEAAFRALKLVRLEYVLIAYFALKRVPLQELYKTIEILLYITIPLCIIQIVHVLSGRADFVSSIAEKSYMSMRMGFIPDTAVFFFSYLLLKKKKSITDLSFFIIIAASIVLGNVRGLFIAIIITTAILLFKQKKIKYLLLGTLIIPIMWSNFQDNSQKEDPIKEISITINKIKNGNIRSIDISEGNLEFRIVLVMERVEYMMKELPRFIFGIGTIEEQSPNNKLSFYIGSGNIDNEGNYYRQQIETTDVAFISDFLRYGFVYLVFFICFIVAIYKTAIRNCSKYSEIAIFIITVYLLAAPSNNYLSNIGYLFPIMLATIIGMKENELKDQPSQLSQINGQQYKKQQ